MAPKGPLKCVEVPKCTQLTEASPPMAAPHDNWLWGSKECSLGGCSQEGEIASVSCACLSTSVLLRGASDTMHNKKMNYEITYHLIFAEKLGG